jgi:hypothetical protein
MPPAKVTTPLRLLALPLSLRPNAPSIYFYAQISMSQNEVASTRGTLSVSRLTEWSARKWDELGQAKKGGWKHTTWASLFLLHAMRSQG